MTAAPAARSILAIDPGFEQSAYLLFEATGDQARIIK